MRENALKLSPLSCFKQALLRCVPKSAPLLRISIRHEAFADAGDAFGGVGVGGEEFGDGGGLGAGLHRLDLLEAAGEAFGIFPETLEI